MTKPATRMDYRHILDRYVERRNSPRYPFVAEIEAIDTQTNTRMVGRTSDISKLGCYVDTMSPFAKNAAVAVAITKNGQTLRARANIVYSMAGMGMGLAFTTIEPDQAAVLEGWLESVCDGAPAPPVASTAATAPPGTVVPPAAEKRVESALQSVVAELISLLNRKNLVNSSEATELLRKLTR